MFVLITYFDENLLPASCSRPDYFGAVPLQEPNVDALRKCVNDRTSNTHDERSKNALKKKKKIKGNNDQKHAKTQSSKLGICKHYPKI